MASVTQIPNGDWFEYIPQAGPVFKCVAGTLLARFAIMDEGLNTVYIQIREAGNSIILAPAQSRRSSSTTPTQTWASRSRAGQATAASSRSAMC
jgi:hypothetical protein